MWYKFAVFADDFQQQFYENVVSLMAGKINPEKAPHHCGDLTHALAVVAEFQKLPEETRCAITLRLDKEVNISLACL